MGGFGSGRTRTHTSIDDCLVLDTTQLRKLQMLPGMGKTSCTIEWQKWTERDFIERKTQSYRIQVTLQQGENPTISLYQGERGREVCLVSTPCHYGHVRWWFTCPTCAHRVRVLYINPKGNYPSPMTPRCRECLKLHYSCQMQSYIERHKTYERYLLANYGLYWAAHRYDFELKEHYLKMTPELWALRLQSVTDWNLHVLQAIIRCDLALYRSDVANLKSIRSDEDRRVYLEHMQKRERELNTLGVIKVVQQCIAFEQLRYEMHTSAMPDDLEQYEPLADLDCKIDDSVLPDAPTQTVEQKVLT